MKIVDRATFLSLPGNTVYSKLEGSGFSAPEIKGDTLPEFYSAYPMTTDFWFQPLDSAAIDCSSSSDKDDLIDDAISNGSSFNMDFYCEQRDAFFEEGQMFVIWEQGDIKALIDRLSECLDDK